jgi:hypothetical protein
MAHFAKIENGIVTQVIVAEKDFINSGAVGDEFNWVQTSYSNSFRGKFASIGDTWDSVNQVFMPPQPYPSWTYNEDMFQWVPPIAVPDPTKMYEWDEETTSWVRV